MPDSYVFPSIAEGMGGYIYFLLRFGHVKFFYFYFMISRYDDSIVLAIFTTEPRSFKNIGGD